MHSIFYDWVTVPPKKYSSSKEPNKLSETDAAYMAGIFDGEGCINYRDSGRYQEKASIQVRMTNKEVLTWIADKSGLGNCTQQKTLPSGKECFQWSTSGWGAALLLLQLDKYIIVKRDIVDGILVYYELV